MDTQRLDGHKKVLGILYLVSAALTTLGMLVLNAFLSFMFSYALDEIEPDEQKIAEFVMSIVQFLPAFVIIVFSIPTLIAGIALLTRQTWATTLAMIIGCFKLFSFPIGTAIGIYAIWTYSEDQKLSRVS
jgi:hypothetical protein